MSEETVILYNALEQIDSIIQSYCSNPELTEFGKAFKNLEIAAKEFDNALSSYKQMCEEY